MFIIVILITLLNIKYIHNMIYLPFVCFKDLFFELVIGVFVTALEENNIVFWDVLKAKTIICLNTNNSY